MDVDDGTEGKEITIEEMQGLAQFYEERLETVSEEKEQGEVRRRISGIEETLKKMRAGIIKLSYYIPAKVEGELP